MPRQILGVHPHLSKSKKRYIVRESLGSPVITQQFLLWGVDIAHQTPVTVMFMTNSMLLWWTLESKPLPLVKVLRESLQWRGERKCNVTSIEPNWQANWNHNAITSLLLNDTFVRRTTDLEKTVNTNWLLISL